MSENCWICGNQKTTGGCLCNTTLKSEPPQTSYRLLPATQKDAILMIDSQDATIAALRARCEAAEGKIIQLNQIITTLQDNAND